MIYHTLFIKESEGRGRGVFTKESIPAGTLIEQAPVIVMSDKERKLLDQTLLHDYIFEWGDDKRQCAMALGWVAIYNHSHPSNAEYEMDYEAKIISVTTVKEVTAGEEILINYNGDWDNNKPVWFSAK